MEYLNSANNMETPQISRSPYLNQLLKVCNLYFHDESYSSFYLTDIQNEYKKFKDILDSLAVFFQKQKSLQEKTEEIEESNRYIDESWEYTYKALGSFEAFFAEPSKEKLSYATEELKQGVDCLFKGFDMLKDAEDKLPKYSPTPIFNELIRVMIGLREQRLPAEYFQEVAGSAHMLVDNTYREFKFYERSNLLKNFPEPLAKVDESYGKFAELLKTLAASGMQPEAELLDNGVIEQIKSYSSYLSEINRQVYDAINSPPTKECMYCGTANDLNAKYCIGCQAQFRVYSFVEHESGVDLNLNDGVAAAAEKPMGANLQLMLNTADALFRKEYTPQEAEKVFSQILALIHEGRQQHETMDFPEKFSPEDKELAHTSGTILLSGINKMEEGLKELVALSQDGDQMHVYKVQQLAEEANDAFWDVQQISQQLWEKYEQPETNG